MKRQRFAAHRIYTALDCFVQNGVLVIEDGFISRIESLTEEVPFTEWIGGVIILSYKAALDLHQPSDCSLSIIIQSLSAASTDPKKPRYAWHFDSVDFKNERVLETTQIVRLN